MSESRNYIDQCTTCKKTGDAIMKLLSKPVRYIKDVSGIPIFAEKWVGIADAKSNQVVGTDQGYTTIRVCNKARATDAYINQVYAKMSSELEPIMTIGNNIITELKMLNNEKPSPILTSNEEIRLRIEAANAVRAGQIEQRKREIVLTLSIIVELLTMIDETFRHRIDASKAILEKRILKYWSGVLKKCKIQDLSYKPYVPEVDYISREIYESNLERMMKDIESVVNNTVCEEKEGDEYEREENC